MITVWLNNEQKQLPAAVCLAEALSQWQPPGGGFAIAINQVFVPRANYSATPLRDGDQIELLIPMQGG